MKTTAKKLIAVLLTVMMALSALAMLAGATGKEPEGKITITNAVAGQEYSIYRIFDLYSYDKDAGAYVYNVNKAWESFIDQPNISGTDGYVNVDVKTGAVSWIKKNGEANVGMEDFAKAALQYAKDYDIAAVKSVSHKTTGDSSVAVEKNLNADTYKIVISGLELGYYLLDSNVGTLCSLDTTNPSVDISDKNGQPTVEKKVNAAKAGNPNWQENNTAQIGDRVEFKTTINVEAGAQNYVLHDKMEEGFTFTKQITENEGTRDNVSVKIIKNNTSEEPVVTSNYEVVISETGDDCTFHVKFKQDFCNTLAAGDKLVVYYSAVLNEKAKVGSEDNDNETWLKYGEKNDLETTHDDTHTYTYQFQLVKTDEGENNTYTVLEGAEFELYDAKNSENKIPMIAVYKSEGSTEVE